MSPSPPAQLVDLAQNLAASSRRRIPRQPQPSTESNGPPANADRPPDFASVSPLVSADHRSKTDAGSCPSPKLRLGIAGRGGIRQSRPQPRPAASEPNATGRQVTNAFATRHPHHHQVRQLSKLPLALRQRPLIIRLAASKLLASRSRRPPATRMSREPTRSSTATRSTSSPSVSSAIHAWAIEIYQLNRDVLKSPELLPIGAEIKLPPRPLADAKPNAPPLANAPAPTTSPPALVPRGRCAQRIRRYAAGAAPAAAAAGRRIARRPQPQPPMPPAVIESCCAA